MARLRRDDSNLMFNIDVLIDEVNGEVISTLKRRHKKSCAKNEQ